MKDRLNGSAGSEIPFIPVGSPKSFERTVGHKLSAARCASSPTDALAKDERLRIREATEAISEGSDLVRVIAEMDVFVGEMPKSPTDEEILAAPTADPWIEYTGLRSQSIRVKDLEAAPPADPFS